MLKKTCTIAFYKGRGCPPFTFSIVQPLGHPLILNEWKVVEYTNEFQCTGFYAGLGSKLIQLNLITQALGIIVMYCMYSLS